MNGIVVFAIGHPNYAKMAVNLALTLKATGENVPVAFLYSKAHGKYKQSTEYIRPQHKDLFSHYIEVPEAYFTYKGKYIYQKAKTYAYDLSPFEQTLVLDADSLWSHQFRGMNESNKHSPTALLNSLSGIELTYTLYNSHKNLVSWLGDKTTIEDLRQAFSIPNENDFYNIQSSVMYFEKGIKAERYFSVAQRLYDTFDLPCVEWGGALPDELIYNIVSAMMGIVPHNVEWNILAQPVSVKFSNSTLNKIFEQYPIMSMSGSKVPPAYVRAYNTLISQAHNVLKDNAPPNHYQDKKEYLSDRRKM